MTQVAVSLTDYGLFAECSLLGTEIWRTPEIGKNARVWMAAFFFSIALAAAAGGTVHGFYSDESTAGYRVLWSLTLIALGIVSISGFRFAAAMLSPKTVSRHLAFASLALFAVYLLVVLFVTQSFLVAIAGYLPALMFVGAVFLALYRRRRVATMLVGFLGVGIMLVAAGLQQAKIGINPHYFDYNAFYHVLQAVALYMLFIAAHSYRPGESNH